MKFKKVTILILAISLIFISAKSSKAEGEKRYHHAISGDAVTDILGYGYGIFGTYEQQLSAKNSFTIMGHYQILDNWNHTGIGASYRWYFKINKDPLEGLSIGPFVLLEYVFNIYKGQSLTGFLPSVGGEAAYKFVFDSFVVEPIFRLNIGFYKPDTYGNYRFIGVGCNLGYAWN